MPRANRHFIPGCVWHITHRCHKQEFLLRFAKDRKRWLCWLFEAKKRYLIINRKILLDYFSIQDENRFRQEYDTWVDVELKNTASGRNRIWSESIAVGSASFIMDIQEKLASRT